MRLLSSLPQGLLPLAPLQCQRRCSDLEMLTFSRQPPLKYLLHHQSAEVASVGIPKAGSKDEERGSRGAIRRRSRSCPLTRGSRALGGREVQRENSTDPHFLFWTKQCEEWQNHIWWRPGQQIKRIFRSIISLFRNSTVLTKIENASEPAGVNVNTKL
jgi:hypothetical protein